MFVEDLVSILISLSIYILLGKCILFVLLANEIVRGFVTIILRIWYNGSIKIVPDGLDAIWPANRSMAVVAFRTDQHLPKEKLFAGFVKNVLLKKEKKSDERVYKKLEHIQVKKLGYACWMKDENFDVKNHFRTAEDKIYYKSDISCIVRELVKDMGNEKPQWEVFIVPRYQESGELDTTSIIFFRFHHCYMDGFSMKMMLKEMSSNFTFYINPGEKVIVPPKLWETFSGYAEIFIFLPSIALKLFSNKFKSFWPKQRSGHNNSGTLTRNYAWSKSMELRTIREIRKTIKNASIPVIIGNSFITATKQVLPFEYYPETWCVGELAAILPYKHSGPQNRFSGFPYKINSSIQNELTRLQSSTNEASAATKGPWNVCAFVMGKIMGRFPMLIAHKALAGESYALITSYIPQSMTTIKLLDAVDVLEIWGFPPHASNNGIVLCINMYCNNFKVVASAETPFLEEKELKEIVSRIPAIILSWCCTLDKKDGEGLPSMTSQLSDQSEMGR